MDLTFEACGYLADLMARYARIEAHYRKKAKRDKPLEDALVSVYVAILVYVAEVQGAIEAKAWSTWSTSSLAVLGQENIDLHQPGSEKKSSASQGSPSKN
jgi:hypothetical protein